MHPSQAIRLLTKQLDKLKNLETREDHETYEAWHKHTELLLKKVFGEDSYEARKLSRNDGMASVIVAGDQAENARRHGEAYFRHIKSNRSLLTGVVEFLEATMPYESQAEHVKKESGKRRKMKLFYSWQSDIRPNQKYIMDCLDAAVKEVGNFEIETATRNTKGAVDIAVSILQKIDESDLFLADITIVNPTATDERKTPNPNVMYELGYAVKAKGHEPIILIANSADKTSEAWPFDIRNRRIILREFTADNKKRLIQEFKAILSAHEPSVVTSLTNPYIFMSEGSHTKWANGNTMSLNIKNEEPDGYYLETIEIGGQTAEAERNIDPATTTTVSVSGLPVPPYSQPYEKMTFIVSRLGKKYQIAQNIKLNNRADGKFNFKGFDPRPLDIRAI